MCKPMPTVNIPLRTKETYRFPEISNLYLANHAWRGLPGELGALEPVRALEAELCAAR